MLQQREYSARRQNANIPKGAAEAERGLPEKVKLRGELERSEAVAKKCDPPVERSLATAIHWGPSRGEDPTR